MHVAYFVEWLGPQRNEAYIINYKKTNTKHLYFLLVIGVTVFVVAVVHVGDGKDSSFLVSDGASLGPNDTP